MMRASVAFANIAATDATREGNLAELTATDLITGSGTIVAATALVIEFLALPTLFVAITSRVIELAFLGIAPEALVADLRLTVGAVILRPSRT